MIDRLLLFGATGDLAGRFLFPALSELHAAGELPDSFQIVATARHDLTDDAFRARIAKRLAEHAPDISEDARRGLLMRVRYCRAELNVAEVSAALHALQNGDERSPEPARAVAAYLALPPRSFVPAVRVLGEAGLPRGSRIVVEKPFGEDLQSAVELNRLLGRVAGGAGEGAVFRIDHVLGMATVHNLLGVRLANRVIEPLWNSAHIEEIRILWEETLALEGRAGYYDKAGALKDVMQNHMLQILSLVAMEPPLSLEERDLRDRKVETLRTVRALDRKAMRSCTRRARYTAGHLAGSDGAPDRDVPDYAREEGVDPQRGTETFAELVLELDSWRWAGTRFVLRAGKALSERWKGVIVRFRPVPHHPFGRDMSRPAPNELRIGLDGPETLSLHLTGISPGDREQLTELQLTAELSEAELRAYSQVLLDVLRGDSTLSIRGDEAEEAWRIMTPVLEAWANDEVPLEEYAAGSAGPPSLTDRIRQQDRGG